MGIAEHTPLKTLMLAMAVITALSLVGCAAGVDFENVEQMYGENEGEDDQEIDSGNEEDFFHYCNEDDTESDPGSSSGGTALTINKIALDNYNNVCAISATGKLYCKSCRQGSIFHNEEWAVEQSGLINDVVMTSNKRCILTTSKQFYCENTETNSDAIAVASEFNKIVNGKHHIALLKLNGTIEDNILNTNQFQSVKINGQRLHFRDLVASNMATCGITNTDNANYQEPDNNYKNKIFCWGINDFAESGGGTISAPTEITITQGGTSVTLLPFAKLISGAGDTFCVNNKTSESDSGQTYCWGRNKLIASNSTEFDLFFSEYDNDEKIYVSDSKYSLTQLFSPQVFAGLSPSPIQKLLGFGEGFGCGMTSGGKVKCWGNNDKNPLNLFNESTTAISTYDANKISIGRNKFCGIFYNGEYWVDCYTNAAIDGTNLNFVQIFDPPPADPPLD